ncbi:Ras- protein Rab-1A [Tilletia horrida]|nr:Ras- protein Rab-1A [Tilletia horrida]
MSPPSNRLHLRPRLFWEIRVASGIVVVYDVTDTESFERVATGFRSWANEIRGAEYESSPKILVANKTDLVEQRIITPEQGQALARKMGWLYAETSAKTKTGVEQAFCDLSIPALQRKLDRVAALAHDDA